MLSPFSNRQLAKIWPHPYKKKSDFFTSFFYCFQKGKAYTYSPVEYQLLLLLKFLMKKLLIVLLVLLTLPMAYGWSYPLKEIEGSFCPEKEWTCKITLPRIEKANYTKYQQQALYHQVYTVMRGGTYFWGRDFWFWSHGGVDIASTEGTPVSAAADGEVVYAQQKGERGKVVVIKHDRKGTTLHTVYAHLESIAVKVWEQVKEGQLIGKVGKTGNATGPHVHFQIDHNNGEHPYFPKNCSGTIAEVVNEAKCRNQVKANTLDPILFLETQGEIFLAEQQPKKSESLINSMLPQELNYTLQSPIALLGSGITLEITPPIAKGEVFLKDDITITWSSGTEIFPSKVSYLGQGRTVTVIPKTAGLHYLHIQANERLIKRISLFVIDEQMKTLLIEKSKTNPQLKNLLDGIRRE